MVAGHRWEEPADDNKNSNNPDVHFCCNGSSGRIGGRAGGRQLCHCGGNTGCDWQKIGDFCAIQTWHPAVSKCEQSEEGGATYRTLTTTDGGTIKEKLVEQTDTSYTYDIIYFPLPVANYRSTISVSAEGNGTRVDWKAALTQRASRMTKPRT